ncbi:hypothetical protein HMPREF1624_05780 [Sporothrix schenckii ATCC 58251]|uniref:Arylsulfotransferase N-terminal domain-containing protein n=1 Tax=Sporothrix schenckii (strain ATCC 58251 / de Perez 2211183) TaxID=1391915 RepID=U7PS85_SPOS1|nr:hypothetical protein HMPREF1624_05780 [Sporothrix schenckii ATCC 58251]
MGRSPTTPALLALALAAAVASPASADTTYRSRPDLSPPHLNITIPCNGRCAPGYLFVSPFTTYGEPDDRVSNQVAPYILDSAGDLVWSGFGYFAGWTCNLQVARYQGQDVLFSFEGLHNGNHGHGHGHHTLLDDHYSVVRVLRAGGHRVSDKHEFEIVDETTALLQVYEPVQRNLAAYGGDDAQTWIVDARFQELDIATGDVVFEWSSLDHVSPDESALSLPRGLAGVGRSSATAWDYFHINSVAKGADGHYLVSARHASTIFNINGTDGSVIWRLGGNHSDFVLGDGVRFGFQHHARYFVEGQDGGADVISLFDNSVYGSESAGRGREIRVNPYSRGKYIRLDHAAHTATLDRALEPPAVAVPARARGDPPILTKSQGSLQSLPGGGDLVNWGSEGQVTEYDAAGTPVFHAWLGRGFLRDTLQNYRAFRFNWTGHSAETPAVYAEQPAAEASGAVDAGGAVRLFVSWNGDTVTRAWRFSWGEQPTTDDATGTVWKAKVVPRRGFETSTRIDRAKDVRIVAVKAEALDADGRVLGASSTVAVQQALTETVRKGNNRVEGQDRLGLNVEL